LGVEVVDPASHILWITSAELVIHTTPVNGFDVFNNVASADVIDLLRIVVLTVHPTALGGAVAHANLII